ncbi:response regulator [Sphingomonas sp.]|uniref:response regulator n=1 Tax=Sphingomonas sp. TaxID=28214 RepID=UPI0035AEA6B9
MTEHAQRQTQPSLLIVDDEPDFCTLLKELAADAGFSSRIVHDGEAFKSAYAAQKPTIIVLDLSVPRRDGIELLRYLAAASCDVPILMISGYGERVLESARRLGDIRGLKVSGIICKPFDHLAFEQELHKARLAA